MTPVRLTAPPARLAMRHGSGLCIGLDAEVLDTARRLDEAAHSDAAWEAHKRDWAATLRRLDVSRG